MEQCFLLQSSLHVLLICIPPGLSSLEGEEEMFLPPQAAAFRNPLSTIVILLCIEFVVSFDTHLK